MEDCLWWVMRQYCKEDGIVRGIILDILSHLSGWAYASLCLWFGLGGVMIGTLAGAIFDEGPGAVSAVGIAVMAGPSRKPLA
jgi:hypothetical protein